MIPGVGDLKKASRLGKNAIKTVDAVADVTDGLNDARKAIKRTDALVDPSKAAKNLSNGSEAFADSSKAAKTLNKSSDAVDTANYASKALKNADEVGRKALNSTDDFFTDHVKSLNTINTNPIRSSGIVYKDKSIDKAFGKHGHDFGKYSDGKKSSVMKFREDIKEVIDTSDFQKLGRWREFEGTHIYKSSTNQWVFINSDGTFNTGFKLGPSQYEHLIGDSIIY